jgi:hypothetical protein
MAKPIRKKEAQRRRAVKDDILPLGKENFRIIGIGLLIIIAGYVSMLQGSVEGFLPLVLSPILLVAGYCVVIPFGIMYRKKVKPAVPESQKTS